jgi:methionine-S-sulfoxide reductase
MHLNSNILKLLLIIALSPYICLAADSQTIAKTHIKKAVFAGGCFWCMEPPFEKLRGVKSVISGYAGGNEKNPTYEQVSRGYTSHTEVVQVTYDESIISYKELLFTFWRNIDPTSNDRQFVDVGSQYRPGIFYNSKEQLEQALISKKKLSESKVFKKPIIVEVSKLKKFYPAEDYHQDYYKKNPLRYKFYRYNSGRDQFLQKVWKK